MPKNLVPVESSHLSQVGYDPVDQVLYVEFKPRHPHQAPALYAYDDVPAAEHDELLASSSKGGYLNRVIKKRYSYRLVEPEEVT